MNTNIMMEFPFSCGASPLFSVNTQHKFWSLHKSWSFAGTGTVWSRVSSPTMLEESDASLTSAQCCGSCGKCKQGIPRTAIHRSDQNTYSRRTRRKHGIVEMPYLAYIHPTYITRRSSAMGSSQTQHRQCPANESKADKCNKNKNEYVGFCKNPSTCFCWGKNFSQSTALSITPTDIFQWSTVLLARCVVDTPMWTTHLGNNAVPGQGETTHT